MGLSHTPLKCACANKRGSAFSTGISVPMQYLLSMLELKFLGIIPDVVKCYHNNVLRVTSTM